MLPALSHCRCVTACFLQSEAEIPVAERSARACLLYNHSQQVLWLQTLPPAHLAGLTLGEEQHLSAAKPSCCLSYNQD